MSKLKLVNNKDFPIHFPVKGDREQFLFQNMVELAYIASYLVNHAGEEDLSHTAEVREYMDMIYKKIVGEEEYEKRIAPIKENYQDLMAEDLE